MISDKDAEKALKELGGRLRKIRLARGDSMESAAIRIGVSVPTLRAMEKGSGTVAVGVYVAALSVNSRLHELENVATLPKLSFDDIKAPTRKRAPRRLGKPRMRA